ncbi:MAG: hypothetical protein DRQ13_12910 [Ignavibacteriae bacterium]|nr:MAG: hypothetical protein DRQ13_12910 [Ignavibacteriota bacterium]
MKQKLIILITILISFSGIAQVEDVEQQGRIAPNFKLEDINGGIFELNEIIGERIILISFNASICKPCREQVEAFSKIYDEFKEKGLTLIAIATDDVKTVAKVKPYIKSMGYDFTVLYDTEGGVSRLYYAQLVPFSVLINQEGLIIYSHMGYMRGDEIEFVKIINNLLTN